MPMSFCEPCTALHLVVEVQIVKKTWAHQQCNDSTLVRAWLCLNRWGAGSHHTHQTCKIPRRWPPLHGRNAETEESPLDSALSIYWRPGCCSTFSAKQAKEEAKKTERKCVEEKGADNDGELKGGQLKQRLYVQSCPKLARRYQDLSVVSHSHKSHNRLSALCVKVSDSLVIAVQRSLQPKDRGEERL